jgi:hypothetical protein
MADNFNNNKSSGGFGPVGPTSQMDQARGLIDAVLDGRISPGQRRVFEDLVVGDAAIAELYLEMVHLSCCLPFHVTRAVLDLNSAENTQSDASTPAVAMYETMILPALSEADFADADEELLFAPAPISAKTPATFRIGRWGSAATVLVVGIALFWVWRVGHRATAPEGGGSIAKNPIVAPAVPPAVITATAMNAEQSTLALPGMTLDSGQELQISNGAVELTFASGSVVVVHGPAKFHVIDQNAMELEDGELTAHVPVAARGFSVAAPGLVVVDRGTDFGVRLVTGKTASEAHVFSGMVDLTSVDATGQPTAAVVRAVAGQAFSHDAGATTGPMPVAFQPEQFTRDITTLRLPVPMHNTGDGIKPGTADPNWQIVSVPNDPTWKPRPAVVISQPVPGYVSNTEDGKWLGVTGNLDISPAGEFNYRTTLDLTGLDPSTALVSAQIAADNGIADIRVNGISTGISTPTTEGPFNPQPIKLPTNCWKSGLNQIEIIVTNGVDPPTGSGTMTGMRVVWTAQACPVIHR